MRHKEMTRYAFISHMEDYMKQLLKDPLHADTDEFLKYHGFNAPRALEILLDKNSDNENNAILLKKVHINDNGFDENGKKLKDTFSVKYSIPRKDYTKKMRNLYIKLFESNIIENSPLNEDGECAGATNASSSGQYTTPLFGGPIKRKTLYITQEQEEYIKNVISEESVTNTSFGDFGYDAPIGNKNDDFYKEANDHKNIMKKSWNNEK